MSKLDGKIALITGGSSGIGLATALHFVKEGASVFITGRRQPELDAAKELIAQASINHASINHASINHASIGGNVTAIRADVSSLDDLDRLFTTIKQAKGRLDILFANAGVGTFAPLGTITEEDFDATFNTNVKGVLFTVQKALTLMPEGATIVLNASITSIKGMPAFSVYSATKAAVRSFARTWIVDLKERKIRVNVISPGTVPTPAYDRLGLTDDQVKDFVSSQAAAIPLGRVGTPDEIAKAVVFLASDDSSFVNGIELFVDGGIAQV